MILISFSFQFSHSIVLVDLLLLIIVKILEEVVLHRITRKQNRYPFSQFGLEVVQ